jgi:hypothetical protein
MDDVVGELRDCTLCHAPIRWLVSVGSRRFPLDVDPHPAGNVIVVEVDGKIRARILNGTEMPAQQTAYRKHECPRTAPPGPRCTVCRERMNRDLALLERWTSHPACDPDYQRERARQDTASKAGKGRTIWTEQEAAA